MIGISLTIQARHIDARRFVYSTRTDQLRSELDNIYELKNNKLKIINMYNYKVKIKYFSDKIYTNTDIETILQEISIFTDLENIISIIKQ